MDKQDPLLTTTDFLLPDEYQLKDLRKKVIIAKSKQKKGPNIDENDLLKFFAREKFTRSVLIKPLSEAHFFIEQLNHGIVVRWPNFSPYFSENEQQLLQQLLILLYAVSQDAALLNQQFQTEDSQPIPIPPIFFGRDTIIPYELDKMEVAIICFDYDMKMTHLVLTSSLRDRTITIWQRDGGFYETNLWDIAKNLSLVLNAQMSS